MTTATAPAETATADVVPYGTRPDRWAGRRADPRQIAEWVAQFERDGYLLIRDVLPLDVCDRLRADLDTSLAGQSQFDTWGHLTTRMFENSAANRSLFDLEPIVSFAEALVAPDCHVIHNNSFRTPKGGGIVTWHQDDAPHFVVTHGEAPTNIRLPTLLFTGNYYLSDVDRPENGGTEVIPRSHLFGASCPGDLNGTVWADKLATMDHNCAGAGSVVLFNNQCWHRGGPNTSERMRYVTQVSYARRIIGHKYSPFMNYQMPEAVYKDADPRLRRLLGFLPNGAYG